MPSPPPRNRRMALAAAAAAAIAIPAEGLRQWAYYDPPGVLTVCYGSTTNVQKGVFYERAECETRLDSDMQIALLAVDSCAPGMPWQVLAAFGDAAYNIGPRIACDKTISTAARLLAARNYEAACEQLPRWNKTRILGAVVSLPGLTKRREAERQLCLYGEVPT